MSSDARRLCLVAAAALAIVLLGAFSQATVIPLTFDLSNVLAKIAYGAMGLLGTGLLWLAKQGLDTLNRLESKVTDASAKLTTISHELFGVTGTNGMRSDLRTARRIVERHSKVLAVLADREGIDFEEDVR